MFSEYYFYLAAFIDDDRVKENFNVLNDSFPTIYRIDRIQGLKVLEERYRIPYSDRFEEGEFRKRIQFMYGGTLRKIKFEYFGFSVESVLDRLPTAKIEKTEKSSDGKRNVYTISAEVFGDGIECIECVLNDRQPRLVNDLMQHLTVLLKYIITSLDDFKKVAKIAVILQR